MVCEKIDLKFDVERLQRHLKDFVFQKPPFMASDGFGGWSVLSSDGTYTDGWSNGHHAYRPGFLEGKTLEEKLKATGAKSSFEYNKPTEICTGYLAEVMNTISLHQLLPRRARISVLKAGKASSLHRDAPDGVYAVRLHIPIITNPDCVFTCEEGSVHMPADGSAYLLKVNRLHQVFNRSNEDRFHLIMNITDRTGISKHHRFEAT